MSRGEKERGLGKMCLWWRKVKTAGKKKCTPQACHGRGMGAAADLPQAAVTGRGNDGSSRRPLPVTAAAAADCHVVPTVAGHGCCRCRQQQIIFLWALGVNG